MLSFVYFSGWLEMIFSSSSFMLCFACLCFQAVLSTNDACNMFSYYRVFGWINDVYAEMIEERRKLVF